MSIIGIVTTAVHAMATIALFRELMKLLQPSIRTRAAYAIGFLVWWFSLWALGYDAGLAALLEGY